MVVSARRGGGGVSGGKGDFPSPIRGWTAGFWVGEARVGARERDCCTGWRRCGCTGWQRFWEYTGVGSRAGHGAIMGLGGVWWTLFGWHGWAPIREWNIYVRGGFAGRRALGLRRGIYFLGTFLCHRGTGWVTRVRLATEDGVVSGRALWYGGGRGLEGTVSMVEVEGDEFGRWTAQFGGGGGFIGV